MEKLKEILNKLIDKYKSFSKKVKIAIIIAVITILITIITVMFYNSSNKYKILFSNLDSTDAQYLLTELTDKGVDMKVEGSSILVPSNMVDELRLELASNLSGGSEGYELIDNSSSFGMTDEEFKLKKLRAQQGELEKTIKYFPQINTVRVHITEAKDSVFVEDKKPGKTAVYIDLKTGNTLTKEQVKSIVALISASISNVPEENVQVIDSNMNLLTKNLDSNSNEVSSETIQSQFDLETQYEQKLEKSIISMLEPVIGTGKITSSVKVDLDFDSKQKTETIIDPSKVIISQHTIKEINNSNDGTTSESPVDNNMSTTIDENSGTTNSTKEEVSTNYDTGKTETQTISAPGEVKRLTATVFINGNLDGNIQTAIEDAVANAIGINLERGDSISIIGMQFDSLSQETNQEDIDAINDLLKEEKTKQLILYGSIGIITLIILTAVIVFIRKKSKNKNEEDENILNVVIDDIIEEPTIKPKKINFEPSNEQIHVENEIKKYATDKPEQVADIIKSWLAENER